MSVRCFALLLLFIAFGAQAGAPRTFTEAKKAFGDWLPQISYDTYDAVMKKLDNWVADAQDVA